MIAPQPVPNTKADSVSSAAAAKLASAFHEAPMAHGVDLTQPDIRILVRRNIAAMPLVRAHAAARAPAFEREGEIAMTAPRDEPRLLGRFFAMMSRASLASRRKAYPLPAKTCALIANLIALR